MRSRNLAIVIATVAAVLNAACGDVNAALGQLAEARRLSAELLVEFTRAADAANRAVMADTDAMSISDAQDARAARGMVHKDIDALEPILEGLGYADEGRDLQEFTGRFAAYEKLDDRVLDLAVENTNLKAQRLSFGPAQAAADEFRDALAALVPARDPFHVQALSASAIAAVREIQALQAPHIAAAGEEPMASLERRMSAAEAAARRALSGLAPLVVPASGARLQAAGKTLDQFMAVNAQILALSHRNTNVRSLALSLDEKRTLIRPCEESVRALQAALGRHGYSGGPHPGGR